MERVRVFSTVKPNTLKKTLFRGTFLAATGITLLVLTALFLPANLLRGWGVIIFAVAALLSGFGLLPYRRLIYLETHPDSLTLYPKYLEIKKGSKAWHIPLEEIGELVHVEDGDLYGIYLHFQEKSQESLFIPYFSQRSCIKLQSTLQEELLALETN